MIPGNEPPARDNNKHLLTDRRLLRPFTASAHAIFHFTIVRYHATASTKKERILYEPGSASKLEY